MKTWNYSLTTNTIWTSFDYGQVEAETREEALILAEKSLREELNLVNKILASNHYKIEMDFSQIEITEVK